MYKLDYIQTQTIRLEGVHYCTTYNSRQECRVGRQPANPSLSRRARFPLLVAFANLSLSFLAPSSVRCKPFFVNNDLRGCKARLPGRSLAKAFQQPQPFSFAAFCSAML